MWTQPLLRRMAAAFLRSFVAGGHLPEDLTTAHDTRIRRVVSIEGRCRKTVRHSGRAAWNPPDHQMVGNRLAAANLLRWDEATFWRIFQKVGLDYPSCRGRLEAGDGIGRDCVLAFAPRGAFTETQVRDALSILKDSGRMADIIAEAQEGGDRRSSSSGSNLKLSDMGISGDQSIAMAEGSSSSRGDVRAARQSGTSRILRAEELSAIGPLSRE
jgi:hypothetical protein